MTEKLTDALPTDRLFWPKWQIKFDDDTVYPASFSGVHLGAVAEIKGPEYYSKRHFFPPLDMLFIDNYVFEHYERPDVEISFEADGGLPKTLDVVQKVAIDASSLSHSEEKDAIWCKKLRFILRNFPKIRAITVLAAIVLDMASPASMPKPIYFMDIGNASVQDRVRHGVLTGDDVGAFPYNPETLRPSDFAMQEWDSLPVEWPAFGERRRDGTAPELYMGAMVLFGKEWISLEGVGAPGRPCKLGDRGVDTIGAIVRREKDRAERAARAAQADTKVAGKRNVKKKASMFTLRHKSSGTALSKKTSTLSLRSRAPKATLTSRSS